MIEERRLNTAHGDVYVAESGDSTSIHPALLLIHGNSSSSRVFHRILTSPFLTCKHRILAFDLPGHGSSSNAPEPESTYTMRGYAECAVDVLTQLGVSEVVVLGWSLGGHVALEMIPLLKSSSVSTTMKGAMLVGTPPSSGPNQTALGFFKESKSPHMHLAGQEHLTNQEAYNYAHTATGAPIEAWQQECAVRTDGRARRIMFSAFAAGLGVDQVGVVEEEKDILLGVVNGAAEPFVNLDYLDRLSWGRLWEGKCFRLSGLGHAPFWEKPEQFEPILARFLEDCEKVA
jgi:pimeloyl-ACP methyl ester carboxylesterase